MDFDDYERLPSTSVATNMTAGATAGILEHCVMYPMDSIKTRMQSMSPISAGQTIASTYRNMVLKEGYFRPIRGMGAVVAGAGPAHALYFATYEYTKEQTMRLFPHHNELNYITSSVMATLIHDAISTPTEVIKQRLQMYNSPFKTIVQCTKCVYQTEGLRAFYRSYNTQLIMNLPYQAIHFSTYEFMQNMLNKDHRYNPPVHMVAGAMGGALASAFTTPLDVIKTLLNTQETGIGVTKGMREAVKQIYTMAGPLGFFKGMQARVLYAMPATAICWSTYEFAKFILSRESREQYHTSPTPKLPTTPKEVLASAADKVRLDEKLRYVLPRTSAGSPDADDQEDDSTATTEPAQPEPHQFSQEQPPPVIPDEPLQRLSGVRHGRTGESSTSSSGSLLSRELPSMSGAGVYSSALSLNTMHTDSGASRRPGMPFEGRGCST